ncbi:MAG: glycosyltransferase family 9 protein [Bacteroidales bacterium]|nr:glycosyltransferase family 9 protein [Bacteroidales bacterium]MCF8388316.1 glycosyltransferase family 9 protein [Bacteroidales bacterium]MCF8396827.1 glycosyltransferase family 9 protein [Bacteroidales bacterium]
MKKFLVIQTASIGDVILATPVLEKLNRFFPDASIDMLIKKGNENLLNNHPFLNDILVWDKSEEKYKNLLRLLRFIQNKEYAYVINLQRFASSGFLTVFSRARHTVGFSKNPFSLFFGKRIRHRIGKNIKDVHEKDRNLKLIEHFTDASDENVKLYPTQADFARVSQYKTKMYICIAPASLWYTKQYPKEKWVEFLRKTDQDLQIIFIGGPGDRELCQKIIDASDHKHCLNLAGSLNFLQTSALMKDAAMNYVNDSAPQHLASAMNAPVTAVFCSTVPEFGFGPLSDDSVVIQTDVDLKCKPCGLHGFQKCPEKHFKCALTIDNNKLLDRLK